MNSLLLNHISLDLLLRTAAVAQFAVAILNLFLVRIMKWKPDLERAPLLIREVFRIHVVFISITLSIFVAIGLFWLVRSAMQWLHYSASHWHGNSLRTLIHWTLFVGYGAMAFIYFAAGLWRNA